MKPPTRKKTASRSKDLPIEEYSRWNLGERKQLLKALEKYSVNQVSEIAKMVETKSEVEVKFYLSKLKRSLKTDTSVATSSEHRRYIKNIQAWIRFTHRLVDDEEQSYSSMIGKLLALYGQNCFKKMHPAGVSFKMIYEYLAGLCIGVQCRNLRPLESAIVLDLLRNVATILGKSNTTQQKEFVLMNFQKQMFPKCKLPPKKKLFAEVQASPGSLLSPLPSSSKTRPIRKRKVNLVTGVCTEDSQPQEDDTRQSAWYKMPNVPHCSQAKRKFSANWSTELLNDSASKAKKSKHLPESSTNDAENEFSEEIPSTSQIVDSSDPQANSHSESELSNGTFLTSKSIKQESHSVSFQIEQNNNFDSNPDTQLDPSRVLSVTKEIIKQGEDYSSVQPEIDNSNPNKEQTPRRTEIIPLTNTSEPFHFPNGEESSQVPMGGTASHLPNENTAKKNMDNTDVIALKKLSGDIVQKTAIRSNILQSPIKVKETPDKISHNPSNPNPQGSQIHKKQSLLSHLFQCPIENVSREKAESFYAQKPVVRLNPSVSLVSNLLQNQNADIMQQGAGNSPGKQVDESKICQVNRRATDKEPSQLEGSTVEGSAVSQSNEKQLCDKSVETELSDSDSDVDKFTYKPSVSWLNPINIPAHFINFALTKQK